MGSKTSAFCREPTEALRERSPERLRASLGRYMLAAEPEVADSRDVLVGFAAYFDCAERLGLNPVELFESAARGRTSEMKILAAAFCRRSDVTLAAFGWVLVEHDGGPCYRPESISLPWQTRRTTRSCA